MYYVALSSISLPYMYMLYTCEASFMLTYPTHLLSSTSLVHALCDALLLLVCCQVYMAPQGFPERHRAARRGAELSSPREAETTTTDEGGLRQQQQRQGGGRRRGSGGGGVCGSSAPPLGGPTLLRTLSNTHPATYQLATHESPIPCHCLATTS